jgi:outer membrane protein assembly factor BamB
VSSSPTLSHDDKVVYVSGLDADGKDVNLYAVQASNGTPLWSFPVKIWTDRPIYYDAFDGTSPTLSSDDKVVYVAGADKNLYAVNASDGTQLWNFTTGDYVGSSPALSRDDKVVYVGSNDGNLYAVNAVDGTQLWIFTTGDNVGSSPTVSHDGKVVYVGSDDNNLYAVNAVDGTQLWSFTTGGAVKSSPTLSSDGKVYIKSEFCSGSGAGGDPIACGDGILYAINA